MTHKKFIDYLPWILAVFIAVVFVQSLFFKFSNSFETRHIFSTIGDWMAAVGFPTGLAEGFATYGGYTVGSIELLAAILLLIRRTQVVGAAISFCVISGAIFFHLATPLGVSVIIDEAGTRDGGQLFSLAIGVFVSSLGLLWLRRQDLVSRNH